MSNLLAFEALCQTRCFQKKKIYFYSIRMRSLILALNFVPELQLFDIFLVLLSFIDLFGVRTFDHNYQMPNVF